VSRRRGDERVNLALLTDGLRAEREQGITIDVAYRYFATKRRKFIIADTPGHIQYTRNMVTGASTASLSIILVDARQGLVEQSRRHAFIASMLRIPHLVFAVNKMDLVDWSEARFREIETEFRNFAARLDVQDITFIPVSALTGANVVDKSLEMPWYQGPTLLYHLETVHIASDRNLQDVRFPVQWVIRPQSDEHHDYRGYAGQVAGGVLRVGDDILALPSGLTTKVTQIEQLGVPVEEAFPPMSVTVHLADDVDVGRGDMLCRPNNHAIVGQDLDAMVCWMADKPLAAKGRYALKHTTRWTRAVISDVLYRLDVNTGHRDESLHELRLNDLGRIRLRTTTPVVYDEYRRNRTTGSFILVDEATNATVGAGMLIAPEIAG
jgi:bifunctional enzyme CysN/CysC